MERRYKPDNIYVEKTEAVDISWPGFVYPLSRPWITLGSKPSQPPHCFFWTLLGIPINPHHRLPPALAKGGAKIDLARVTGSGRGQPLLPYWSGVSQVIESGPFPNDWRMKHVHLIVLARSNAHNYTQRIVESLSTLDKLTRNGISRSPLVVMGRL